MNRRKPVRMRVGLKYRRYLDAQQQQLLGYVKQWIGCRWAS